jgi:hypothetical protein
VPELDRLARLVGDEEELKALSETLVDVAKEGGPAKFAELVTSELTRRGGIVR